MDENSQKEKGGILRFFSNPIVGLLSILIGLISITLAIYFYVSSKEKRELVYFVNPVRTEIVKKGDFSNLEVYYNSLKLNTDVTAVQIAFWNEGELPIKKENILKNIEIDISPAEFLEVTVRKVTRDVTHFAMDANNFNNKKIGITWDILEEDDGGVIQIIYAGKSDLDISVTGVIEGQKVIEEYKYSGNIKSASEQFKQRYLSGIELIIFYLIGVLILFFFGFLISFLKRLKIKKIFFFGIFVIIVVVVFLLIYNIEKIIINENVPPFGF